MGEERESTGSRERMHVLVAFGDPCMDLSTSLFIFSLFLYLAISYQSIRSLFVLGEGIDIVRVCECTSPYCDQFG